MTKVAQAKAWTLNAWADGSKRSYPEPAETVSGLLFPSNGDDAENSYRFHFSSPPSIQPLTLIWKINVAQQSSYHTTFFWGEEGGSIITSWAYFGCHPYPNPPPNGTNHNWEIAIAGIDDTTDENGNNTAVVKDQWFTQAAIARAVGTALQVDFYWDLETSSLRRIRHTTDSGYLSNLPSNPGLMFGDAAWNITNECLSGILRGLQIYDAELTLQEILDRMDLSSSAAVVAADPGSLWYCNINPTPDDISDKSGNGNDPAWADSGAKASLWTP